MVLNSLSYALFVAVLFLAYWFLVPVSFRRGFLLVSSFILLFYAYPAHSILILAMSSIVYLAGELIASQRTLNKKLIFILTVIFILGVLIYYKYLPFIAQTINYISELIFNKNLKYDMLPEQIIPVGISFFTFRFVHYLIEIRKGTIEDRGYLKFLAYTFFFPIIIAGPIERYNNFANQENNISAFKWEYLNEGLSRIILGLFKKVVIADSLSLLANGLYNPNLDKVGYLAAIYAYTFMIYFDFSGYSDLAIGTGRLLGFKIMENFNTPYLQRNISLFWKCWHISLTGWLREYVFIPLGGSRGTLAKTIINTLIVMTATGIWHGAAWHYIAWGLYHAAGLIALRLYNRYIAVHMSDETKNSPFTAAVSIFLTFNFTAFGWILFANGFDQSLHIIKVLIS